jgi:predicted nucleic acid-binding protein
MVDALQMFARQTMDIVDCLLLAKAHSGKGRLLSFDKDLNRLVLLR